MAFTTGNDTNILQGTDTLYVGAGAGNDRYILAPSNTLASGQTINITDNEGTNTLQLIGGLTITSSVIAATAARLVLSNGAIVNIAGANTFSYEIGGDPLAGTAGTIQNFTSFVTTTLGAASVPTGTATTTGTANKTIPSTSTSTAPTFSVAAGAASVTEGGNATFTVTLSAAQSVATTVTATLTGTGSPAATIGTDTGTMTATGATLASGVLTFPAGVVTATVTVPVTFDTTVETGEGISLALSAATGITGITASSTPAAVALADSPAPTFTLTSNAIAGAATTEGNTITYTITPSGITDKAYAFTLTTVGDTLSGVASAASGSDFSPAASTVSFAAGATAAQTVVQTIVADGITEGLEGYKTTLLNSSFVAVGTPISGLINDGSVSGTIGTTYTLTTGIDSPPGTSADDTFLGDHLTMQASDVITGGLGTDTLSYTDGSTTGVTMPVATVSGVEKFNIRNVNTSGIATESAIVTITNAILAGDVVTIAGRTVTGVGAGDTAANVAAAFVSGTSTPTLTVGGTLTGFTVAAGAATAPVFTSTTPSYNVTDITTSVAIAGAGTITAVAATTQGSNGVADTVAASSFAGAMNFNSNLSTANVNFTGLTAGQQAGIIGNGAVTNGDVGVGYANTVTAGVINVDGGTTRGVITETGTGITSNTINSTGAANTLTNVVLSGTANTALTINAATNLTTGNITGFTGTASTITVAGAATSVNIGTLENTTVASVSASGMSAGGVTFVANTNPALVFVGGLGNDAVTVGATALTTGSMAAGAGTGDRLTVSGATTAVATSALGAKFSGFEVLGAAGTVTVDMDNLAANNTFTSLVLGTGTNIINNVNPTAGSSVLVTASGTDTINIKGATLPSQVDTMALTVSDGSATVNTITLTAPSIAGVENVNLTATDHVTITSLANAAALINVGIVGAGNVSITTSSMALQTNFAVNAGTATGNLIFNATGETTNGFSVVGSSGINTITGGRAVFTANLAASTAKADIIAMENAGAAATGGTLALPNVTISGFTNSANVLIGDKLDVISTATIGGSVASAVTTTDTSISAASSATGILTFTGSNAATASLATKIAIATEAAYGGATQYQVHAFEHGGNTYLVENGDAVAGYTAGTDVVIQLTGVTGVTALSTAASAATTVWVI